MEQLKKEIKDNPTYQSRKKNIQLNEFKMKEYFDIMYSSETNHHKNVHKYSEKKKTIKLIRNKIHRIHRRSKKHHRD